MERIRTCVLCGARIEGHAQRYCKACRLKVYKTKKRQRDERPKAGYRSLAKHILIQAIDDYPLALYQQEVAEFLRSKRCYAITGFSGTDILKALERIYAK